MKENVLDVLMYLFETYVETEDDPEPDHNELRDELARAGFADPEIERALDWLDGLTDHQESIAFHAQTSHGLRVYNDFEQERLDAACRGYIAYLEQAGFESVEVVATKIYTASELCGYRPERDSELLKDADGKFMSAFVRATKPK